MTPKGWKIDDWFEHRLNFHEFVIFCLMSQIPLASLRLQIQLDTCNLDLIILIQSVDLSCPYFTWLHPEVAFGEMIYKWTFLGKVIRTTNDALGVPRI